MLALKKTKKKKKKLYTRITKKCITIPIIKISISINQYERSNDSNDSFQPRNLITILSLFRMLRNTLYIEAFDDLHTKYIIYQSIGEIWKTQEIQRFGFRRRLTLAVSDKLHITETISI